MEIIKKSEILEEYYNHFPLTDFFSFNIHPYISVVKFESDEKILNEGDKSAYLFYLIDGRAKLFISHGNGRISLINFISSPCFIGEMELIGGQDTTNGITAITPCTCYAIRVKDCKERILNDIKFLRYICLFLSQKAIRNTYNYSKNQLYPLEVRLARFILLTSHNCLYKEKHTEVAEFLGITYRHLLYVLADLVKRGFLSKTKQGYFIQDINALHNVAEMK
ncbi:regulatory protein YeiL [Clostridium oryzae]|uniref:Regulatory protein YeiL n=1 Tax=Clostridium oryzae TaxID=1450648 RepID=A0A1V4IXW4_9CLOT|nr:transcriptional regulator YeiL [Clostridium oryzae]OPJ64614.1 regulatory protein YeiL [Clostridium oryzae]